MSSSLLERSVSVVGGCFGAVFGGAFGGGRAGGKMGFVVVRVGRSLLFRLRSVSVSVRVCFSGVVGLSMSMSSSMSVSSLSSRNCCGGCLGGGGLGLVCFVGCSSSSVGALA